jgi:hypothetical protein
MSRKTIGSLIVLLGLLFLMLNAVDYLFGVIDVPSVFAAVGIILTAIGAALAKQTKQVG